MGEYELYGVNITVGCYFSYIQIDPANPIQNSTFVIHFYTCHQTPCFASLD